MQLLFCDDPGVVSVIVLLKTFLNLIRFSLPIILIIKVSLDLYKNMINGIDDKGEIKKKTFERITACIIVFLVPSIINLVLTIFSSIDIDTSDYTDNFSVCYKEASRDLVKKLKEQQELKLNAEEEKKRENNLVIAAKYEALRKAQNEAKNNNNNNNTSYHDTKTNLTKLGGVYLENGTFYIPNGASGRNCPSNPLNEGYNNKFGYHNEFWIRLQNLKDAAIKAGYNIDFSTQGCRSYDNQVYLYKKYASTPGRAAKPGTSRHGFGIASDVDFYKNSTTKCGANRTYSNCPGMKWIHENANRFGLVFPLLNAGYKEDWHIEPISIKKY